jgi:hypothetical protein
VTAYNYPTPAGILYTFTRWEGDITGTANPLTLSVDGPKTITAVYTTTGSIPTAMPTPVASPTPSAVPPVCSLTLLSSGGSNLDLTVKVNPPGTTSTYPATYSYSGPTTVTVTAYNYPTPAGILYTFTRWEGDVTGTANPITLSVDGQKTITAVYTTSGSIPTPPVTPCSYTLGDANGNGTIDIVDALLIAQYYVGLSSTSIQNCAADVNRDGAVDIIDALRVAQCYVGLVSCSF